MKKRLHKLINSECAWLILGIVLFAITISMEEVDYTQRNRDKVGCKS